jgi:thiol:disulfide interchange protein DsbA
MKSLLTIVSMLLVATLSYAADIRGYYIPVGPVPAAHSVKKVRFEELLNFGCIHCNNLRKASMKLREEYADQVDFIDIPITFRGQDDSPLRLYYVAEKLGKAKMVKEELFRTHFEYDVNVFDPGIINYLAKSLGVDQEYQAESRKPWVEAMLAEAKRKTEQYGLTGTPTVVIEGSMKMDFERYGSIEKFVAAVPETFTDLLAKP